MSSTGLIEAGTAVAEAQRPAGIDQLRQQLRAAEVENIQLRELHRRFESSRERLIELYELAPVGYADFDGRGFIRQINQTGAALLGRPAADLVGKPFLRFVLSNDLQKFIAHLRQCLQSGTRRSVEIRLRAKGSDVLAVQLWSIPVQDREIRAPIVRTIISDITERKMAEEALHESKECFRIMTDNAPVLVWMSSTDGLSTYFNKAWLEFTGREFNQELGRGWTASVHADDLQRCLDCYEMGFQDRERFSFEFRLRRHDGAFLWFLNTGVPRFTPTGVFAGYIGSCVDITERKAAEELRRQILEDLEIIVQERTANLKAANQKLRAEVAVRKRLEKQIVEIADLEQRRIGNDLHDGLGQQLTGVAFLSKVLEQKLIAKSRPEAPEATQVHQLVNQALGHTRELARGLHVVELEAGGLHSALQDLRNQIEHLFSVSCQLKVDRVLQVANPTVATHVFRIAQEAVNNAVKHGKAKNIFISLVKADRKAVLTVRDDGVGFPSGIGKRGLGLHTMRYRSEMIRGTFDIQRGPEGGTVVTCTFSVKASKTIPKS